MLKKYALFAATIAFSSCTALQAQHEATLDTGIQQKKVSQEDIECVFAEITSFVKKAHRNGASPEKTLTLLEKEYGIIVVDSIQDLNKLTKDQPVIIQNFNKPPGTPWMKYITIGGVVIVVTGVAATIGAIYLITSVVKKFKRS